MKKKYDLVVIGGGPGGYVAAIKAAQLGLETALVEKTRLGGTCLHVGCIPTKALISNAHVYSMIQTASEFGIHVTGMSFDYSIMKARKDRVVKDIWNGLTGLVKSHGIDTFIGTGSFLSPYTLKVRGEQPTTLSFRQCIIATGSESAQLPSFKIDGKKIHDSSSILDMTELPRHLIVLGGGYIGCEFASLFAQLGVKVSVVEFLDAVVQNQGKTISQFLQKALIKKNIDLHLGVKMERADIEENSVKAILSNGKEIVGDVLLVCVGRSPYTHDLHPEKAGVLLDMRGCIPVDSHMQTNVDHIYAIGDVVGKTMLAHVASHEGIVAALNIAGESATTHYHAIPAVIFTDPEIASVGLTEEEALRQGIDATSAQFPNLALGKAVATDHKEGFSQVVFDRKTGQILGATLIGYEAGNMIGEMAVAINNELTLECISETIHPHPTLGEAWMELAHLAEGHPIHMPPKKR